MSNSRVKGLGSFCLLDIHVRRGTGTAGMKCNVGVVGGGGEV